MTERLYYKDSHIREFKAVVQSSEKCGPDFQVILDKTAFFPGGGGQEPDIGTIGGLSVKRVFEEGDSVVHVISQPLETGECVDCQIDWEVRFRRMQAHSGEHVVSGIAHNLFAAENVGFHMGEDGVIVDLNVYLSPEDLRRVELEANRIVMENRAVRSYFPDASELEKTEYRSKKELDGAVRLVEIDGCDICACCAPHVTRTGEIGIIRILDSIRRKNGVRLRMLSGLDALEDTLLRYDITKEVSALLSAKTEEIPAAVKRIQNERESLSYELGGLRRSAISDRVVHLARTEGNMVFFEPGYQIDEQRLLVNGALKYCGGICAVISGDEENGYRYVIASESIDLRSAAKEINQALSGRGGGKPEMITGTFRATRSAIESYLNDYKGVRK